jgi:hypothetical protein
MQSGGTGGGGAGGGTTHTPVPPFYYSCTITISCTGVDPIHDYTTECASSASEAERNAAMGSGCHRSASCYNPRNEECH